MPIELVAPALLAKGAALKGGASFLGLTDLASATPAGMALQMAGPLAAQAAGAAQAAASQPPPVVEEALYLLPLVPLAFMGSSKRIQGGDSRTIRLSTADSRGVRYAEFL